MAEQNTSQMTGGATNPILTEDICKMVQCVQLVMEKNHHLKMLAHLPMAVRRRLRALRKLQLQTSAVEMEFHEKEFELEKEFQAKHKEIFKKRLEIIKGDYEPTDEECDYSDPDILKRMDENVGIFAKLRLSKDVEIKDNADKDNADNVIPVKGVPYFWYHILYSNPMFDFLIHEADEFIVQHLIDIRTTYKTEPHFSFTLEFEFSPNPFFENSVLTKEYLLKIKFDDVLCYEGPAIYKTIGCDINWKTDKSSAPSILDFFNPPILPENTSDPSYEEIKNMLESDFEIGDFIKDNIVPKAILYFTGERDDESDFEESSDSKSTDESEESEESDVPDMFEGTESVDIPGK